MNYAEMSDFEINKKICDLFWPELSKSNICRNKNFEQGGSAVYIKNGYGGFARDYCNSWADAGPIIQEYGIGLMLFKKSDAAAWDVSCGLLSAKKINHENPLRAAMIVFLMMQESK